MHTYYVTKTGALIFDALHAYGLGLVVACNTNASITIYDIGSMYTIISEERITGTLVGTVDEILTLPTENDLMDLLSDQSYKQVDQNTPQFRYTTPLLTFDGVLAALFTTPGIRVVSIIDLWGKQNLNSTNISKALSKAIRSIERWKAVVEHQTVNTTDPLQHYTKPSVPTIVEAGSKRTIALLMTLDPAWSYSSRRMINDGAMQSRTNITIIEPSLAPIFALIGAARFLRAQRVAGNLITMCVPLISSMRIEQATAMPLLHSSALPVNHVLAANCLQFQRKTMDIEASWTNVAYQVLQTQGAHQSISIGRGCVDISWLIQLDALAPHMIRRWQYLISQPQSRLPIDKDNLSDCLLHRQIDAWVRHLVDLSDHLLYVDKAIILPYISTDVRKVTNMLYTGTSSPLSKVLERNQGTLRFGRALRQLGRYRRADLRELVEQFERVHTQEQFLFVLANAVELCVISQAKNEFAVVPTDQDFQYLLEDVAQHGVRQIIALLLVLASLSYPRNEDASREIRS